MTEPQDYPSYPADSTGAVPPPPPGYHPPGQAPYGGGQPPAQGYGYAPPSAYASWGARVGAYLLDALIGIAVALPLGVIGGIIIGATATSTTDIYGNTTLEDANPLGFVFIGLTYVVAIAFSLWNYVFRQGRKGQTLGKKIVGIKVVKEATGQPMGAGLAFGRMLLLSLLSAVTCYINLLWPLWDEKKQTLHDKVVSTVVLSA